MRVAAFASQVAARRMGPICAESGRLASLLDKLLLLARAEAGSVPREGVHLELADLVTERLLKSPWSHRLTAR